MGVSAYQCFYLAFLDLNPLQLFVALFGDQPQQKNL